MDKNIRKFQNSTNETEKNMRNIKKHKRKDYCIIYTRVFSFVYALFKTDENY